MMFSNKHLNPARRFAGSCITGSSGCGTFGDTASLKSASELAIHCQTDAALAAIARAEQVGEPCTCIAELERVGVLQDEGLHDAAEKALQGCDSDSIELQDWYRETNNGNIWRGTCRHSAGETITFAINVDGVWSPH